MNIEQLKKTVKYCDVTPDRNLLYPDTLPLGRVGKDRSLIVLVLDGEDTVQTAAQRRLVNDLKTNTHTYTHTDNESIGFRQQEYVCMLYRPCCMHIVFQLKKNVFFYAPYSPNVSK